MQEKHDESIPNIHILYDSFCPSHASVSSRVIHFFEKSHKSYLKIGLEFEVPIKG